MEKNNNNQRGVNVKISIMLFVLTSISVYLLVVVHVDIYKRYRLQSTTDVHSQVECGDIERFKRHADAALLKDVNATSDLSVSVNLQRHHRHWIQKYLELNNTVSYILSTMQPFSIKLRCGYDGNQGVHNLTDSGKMKWKWTLNETNQPNGVALLDETYSSPVVPTNGTYLVYCQLTWFSDNNTLLSLEVHKNYDLVVITRNETEETEERLISSSTTQRDPRPKDSTKNSADSAYTSGVFRLSQGQIIAMRLTTRQEFFTSSSDTYLGLHFLNAD